MAEAAAAVQDLVEGERAVPAAEAAQVGVGARAPVEAYGRLEKPQAVPGVAAVPGAGGTGSGSGGPGGGGEGTGGGGGTGGGSGGPGGGGLVVRAEDLEVAVLAAGAGEVVEVRAVREAPEDPVEELVESADGAGGPGGGFGGGGGTGGAGGGAGGAGAEPGKWLTATALVRGGVLGGVPGMPGIAGGAGAGGIGSGSYQVAEEEVRSMIGLFAQLGKSRKDPESRMDAATFQSRLSTLPVRAQYTLQQALAGLAAQAPTDKPDKPMLLKLAEHVAIRFALDSYERGELRVNAVKQLLDRMNAEIEALRKILGSQEEMMASAGIQVQSYTELLDQEFWSQVPEENKKEVLTSDEAWCVPPRNVRGFLEEMLRRGELKTVNEILTKYAACVALEAPEARRTTAIGLSDLAEFYGSGDGSALIDVIQRLGNQLSVEREPDLADAGRRSVCAHEPGSGIQEVLSGHATGVGFAGQRGSTATRIDEQSAAKNRRGRAAA